MTTLSRKIMPLPVLICDDSALARKQIARSLPKDWDISISFAENGKIGLESIRQGKGDVLFLDLNMPEMDGYQVLKEIQQHDLPTLVIVISGDIQPQAHTRILNFGALAFIKKPFNNNELTHILEQYGIYKPGSYHSRLTQENSDNIAMPDVLQEVANIAMGKAADLLSRLLDTFILSPIPTVKTIESSELHIMLSNMTKNDDVSAVSQGFISSGISGEAIMIFHQASFIDMATLLKYENMFNEHLEIEVMNDVSNILIGAFLSGLAEQLGIHFSQGQPSVLGQHQKIKRLIKDCRKDWHQLLTIEINYGIQDHDIKCNLLLLFTEDSISAIYDKLGYLLEQ